MNIAQFTYCDGQGTKGCQKDEKCIGFEVMEKAST